MRNSYTAQQCLRILLSCFRNRMSAPLLSSLSNKWSENKWARLAIMGHLWPPPQWQRRRQRPLQQTTLASDTHVLSYRMMRAPLIERKAVKALRECSLKNTTDISNYATSLKGFFWANKKLAWHGCLLRWDLDYLSLQAEQVILLHVSATPLPYPLSQIFLGWPRPWY